MLPLSLLVLLIAGTPLWLRAAGSYLVSAGEPGKAELIVVLAGDDHGNRILKAAELVRQGYAPKILVSGPECCYGHVESDLAIDYAVSNGYPRDWFISFPIEAHSTSVEARLILKELERRHVTHFLVVTSNYHTRRAAGIFRRLAGAERFRMVAAPDWAFAPDSWWRTRDGQKQAFFEWAKTVSGWVGMQ